MLFHLEWSLQKWHRKCIDEPLSSFYLIVPMQCHVTHFLLSSLASHLQSFFSFHLVFLLYSVQGYVMFYHLVCTGAHTKIYEMVYCLHLWIDLHVSSYPSLQWTCLCHTLNITCNSLKFLFEYVLWADLLVFLILTVHIKWDSCCLSP